MRFLYWGNASVGGTQTAPAFTDLQLIFVCLLGALVSVWGVARWLHPTGLMAVIDAWGRSYLALLLAWFIVMRDAPPVLWRFVFTEGIGGVAQFRAAYWPRPAAAAAR